jgi:hypothetical protein
MASKRALPRGDVRERRLTVQNARILTPSRSSRRSTDSQGPSVNVMPLSQHPTPRTPPHKPQVETIPAAPLLEWIRLYTKFAAVDGMSRIITPAASTADGWPAA